MNIIKHFKENLKLALPIAFGQLGQVIVSFSDNIMVGRLGTSELAAVSLAGSVFFIVMVFGFGVASAISPLISEANALHQYKKGMSLLYHNLGICFLLGVFMYILIYLFAPFMYYLGQPPEIIDNSNDFLKILSLALIPWLIYECFRKFSEGISLPIAGMFSTWGGVLLNILLNYLLIYGKYGFPKLGMIGGAYATLISRIFALIVLFLWLLKYPKVWEYYKNFKYKELSKKTFKKVLSIGIPTGLQMFFETGAFASTTFIVGSLGPIYIAAHQIGLNLLSCTFMLCVGFSVASTVIVGKQKALKNHKEMKKAGWVAILMASLFMIISGTLFILFRNKLPYLYGDDDQVTQIAASILTLAIFFQIADGIQVVALGALRGMQDVDIPMKITFLSYWLVALPLAYLFCIYYKMGVLGVWIGLTIGLALAAILLTFRFYKKTYKI